VNNEENSSEENETNLSSDNKETSSNNEPPKEESRPDPFANLELPPPVGSDDDWSEDDGDGHSEAASEDHSALGAARSEPAQPRRERRSKIPSLSLFGEEDDNGGSGGGLFGDIGGFDGGLDSFNDPNVAQLEDAPFLGGRSSGGNLFGNRASGVQGRATSPKIF